MKTLRNLTRALIAALGLAAISAAAWAAGPTECGLIGSWYGAESSGDLVWLGVHTPGTQNKNGQMSLEWVTNNVILPPQRLTGGHGVWEQIRRGQYNYTWEAYVVDYSDSSPAVVGKIVVSGTAENTTCDTVGIRYRLRMYDADGNYLDSIPAEEHAPGYATETRILLVTP